MIQLKTRIHLGIEVFRNHSHKQNLEQGTEEEWKSDTQNQKFKAHLTVGIIIKKRKNTETEDFPVQSYGQQENRCGSLGAGKAWLQVKVTATGRKALSGIFQTEMPCVAMATVTRVGGQPTRVQVSPSDEGNTGLKHCSLRGDAVFLELGGRRRGM